MPDVFLVKTLKCKALILRRLGVIKSFEFATCLISVFVLPVVPVRAQGEWVRVGNYHNFGIYSTALEARSISSEWDSLAESKRLIFQINLQGKDVGAMEFEVLCRTGHFTWERQIVVPTTGARYFSPSSAPHFQQAKIVARGLFCAE